MVHCFCVKINEQMDVATCAGSSAWSSSERLRLLRALLAGAARSSPALRRALAQPLREWLAPQAGPDLAGAGADERYLVLGAQHCCSSMPQTSLGYANVKLLQQRRHKPACRQSVFQAQL